MYLQSITYSVVLMEVSTYYYVLTLPAALRAVVLCRVLRTLRGGWGNTTRAFLGVTMKYPVFGVFMRSFWVGCVLGHVGIYTPFRGVCLFGRSFGHVWPKCVPAFVCILARTCKNSSFLGCLSIVLGMEVPFLGGVWRY